MSVKEAIQELRQATLYARTHVRPSVRLPPVRSPDRFAQMQQGSVASSSAAGFPRVEDATRSGVDRANVSNTSSVLGFSPRNKSQMGALGGSTKSGLNHPSTYHYGESPIKPTLCDGNRYNSVGSYSMFGSQALSERVSSGAFGFGTSTRDGMLRTFISPAHLKDLHGLASPAPDTYTLQSSLGRQVLDSRMTYPARSFGNEDRFDADRRDRRAAITPGPGAYRV